MVILGNLHKTYIHVVKFEEIENFICEVSKQATTFINFAMCKQMKLPNEYLMQYIKINLSEFISEDKYRYIVKIKEVNLFNTFEIYVSVITAKVESDNIETLEVENVHEEIKQTFSAIEVNSNERFKNAVKAENDKTERRQGNKTSKSDPIYF